MNSTGFISLFEGKTRVKNVFFFHVVGRLSRSLAFILDDQVCERLDEREEGSSVMGAISKPESTVFSAS